MELNKFLPQLICVLSGKDGKHEPEEKFREMTRYACDYKLYGVQVPYEFVDICRSVVNDWSSENPFNPHQVKVVGVDASDVFTPCVNGKFLIEWRTLQIIVNNAEADL